MSETKPKASKPKKAAKPKGPSYFDMAKAAILALKDRSGSSLPAIKKYIESEIKKDFAPHLLRSALKAGVASGKIVLIKGSYKLSAAERAI